jgi:hypothetical protein
MKLNFYDFRLDNVPTAEVFADTMGKPTIPNVPHLLPELLSTILDRAKHLDTLWQLLVRIN